MAFLRLAALVALFIFAPARFAPACAQSDTLEYAVKATYLYKFGPFVEWPSAVFATQTAPMNLCVIGRDPFGGVLDRAVEGQYIDSHPIVVRRLPVAERDSPCHVMFVGGSAAQSVAQTLQAVRGRPVLTVTDAAGEPDAKAIIHFVIQANRVRFEIDSLAAAESGLTLSSKLLSLAVAIRRGS